MNSAYFDYVKINGIHRFDMHRADHEAMDAYFDAKYDILASNKTADTYLCIIDFSQTCFPPINFAVAQSVKVMRKFKIKHSHRLLVISNDVAEAQVASMKVKMNPFLDAKFIQPEQEDAYINWLLTGMPPDLAAS